MPPNAFIAPPCCPDRSAGPALHIVDPPKRFWRRRVLPTSIAHLAKEVLTKEGAPPWETRQRRKPPLLPFLEERSGEEAV